ncbi:MAG: SHOCT domain-containing protein [Selenomonadaceae bacterium]
MNNFISYELIMGLMRSLYRKGTISKREYEKAQKIMLKKYRPAAGKTYSDLQ